MKKVLLLGVLLLSLGLSGCDTQEGRAVLRIKRSNIEEVRNLSIKYIESVKQKATYNKEKSNPKEMYIDLVTCDYMNAVTNPNTFYEIRKGQWYWYPGKMLLQQQGNDVVSDITITGIGGVMFFAYSGRLDELVKEYISTINANISEEVEVLETNLAIVPKTKINDEVPDEVDLF